MIIQILEAETFGICLVGPVGKSTNPRSVGVELTCSGCFIDSTGTVLALMPDCWNGAYSVVSHSLYLITLHLQGWGVGLYAQNRFSTSQHHITHCKCWIRCCMWVYAGVGGVSYFAHVLFGPNTLRPVVFEWQASESILPQVSRKESLKPLYWLRAGQSVA